METELNTDAALSRIALAIGEPARTRMLLALLDGRARTSMELATLGEVTASTASVHLNRLKDENLVKVAAQGRHRYYSLRSTSVARALESLGVLAGRECEKFKPNTPEPLRFARTCYDHMAGTLAVLLHDHFFRESWLAHGAGGANYELSASGEKRLRQAGLDLDRARSARRRFAYACLDWSERRSHIGGALGASLLEHGRARRWITRDLNSRALYLTGTGRREMLKEFGLSCEGEPHGETFKLRREER